MSWEQITETSHRHIETGREVALTDGVYIATLSTGFIIGKCEDKAGIGGLLRKKRPEDQSIDDWRNDYNKGLK